MTYISQNGTLEHYIERLILLPADLQKTVFQVIEGFEKQYQYEQLNADDQLKYEDFMYELSVQSKEKRQLLDIADDDLIYFNDKNQEDDVAV